MQRLSIALLLVLLLGTVMVSLYTYQQKTDEVSTPETITCTLDALICPDGTAVPRTGPNCEFAPCPSVPVSGDERIRVTAPRPNDTVTSPFVIKGEARGNWFFEASFPITIVNWDGLIIGEGYATAEGEWMTEAFVPFTATISYSVPEGTPYDRGAIILKKDNPSGLPEHDAAIEIPIRFSEVRE